MASIVIRQYLMQESSSYDPSTHQVVPVPLIVIQWAYKSNTKGKSAYVPNVQARK